MRILLVDDNEDAGEMLRLCLEMEGHDVRFATCPEDALAEAKTFNPEAAIVDIGLPRVDGWRLGELLRRLPGLADLPILALTGYGQPADHQRSHAAGFRHHLVKPCDYGEIRAALDDVQHHELGSTSQPREGRAAAR
jgi:CheY-like chemotaxis protein